MPRPDADPPAKARLLGYRGAFTARYGGTPNWQAASAYYPGIMWF